MIDKELMARFEKSKVDTGYLLSELKRSDNKYR